MPDATISNCIRTSTVNLGQSVEDVDPTTLKLGDMDSPSCLGDGQAMKHL